MEVEKEEMIQIAQEIYQKVGQGIANLRGRWEDEKEYEDFAEYRKVMRSWVEEAYPILKGKGEVMVNKSPFSVQFPIGDFQITIKATLSTTTLTYSNYNSIVERK